jgi:hypothetical protein
VERVWTTRSADESAFLPKCRRPLFFIHESERYDPLFSNGLLRFRLAATGVQHPLTYSASADRHNSNHLLPKLLSGHRVQADDRLQGWAVCLP